MFRQPNILIHTQEELFGNFDYLKRVGYPRKAENTGFCIHAPFLHSSLQVI
jgi:hypothetical protein